MLMTLPRRHPRCSMLHVVMPMCIRSSEIGSENNQSDATEALHSTSRYLDYLLNIDNNFFDSVFNRIYPSEFQLNKAKRVRCL